MFIQQSKENSNLFYWQGRHCVLVTGTEHYGSVINRSFDYLSYLDMLQQYGFNLTRLFLFYREQPSGVSGLEDDGTAFSEVGIQNTLAPGKDSYVAPWLRSDVPGCFDGGNKFDLTRPNPEYDARLLHFVREAGRRGIAVEVVFFSQYYSAGDCGPWKVSPLNGINNINGVGQIAYHEATSLRDEGTVKTEEELVRRVVALLKEEPNIYYEICNEPNPLEKDPHIPYAEIAEWQNHFSRYIRQLESGFPEQHMIAVNHPNPHYDLEPITILNSHYADGAAEALAAYGKTGKILGFDETLSGIVAWNREMDFEARRKEAWHFLFQGYAIYDYLDFTIATEDPLGVGAVEYPFGQYYDGTVMRRYLARLKRFFDGLPLESMKPDPQVDCTKSLVARIDALSSPGRCYALYIEGNSLKQLRLALPQGNYHAVWVDPRQGEEKLDMRLTAGEAGCILPVPVYEQDIALRIDRI